MGKGVEVPNTHTNIHRNLLGFKGEHTKVKMSKWVLIPDGGTHDVRDTYLIGAS